MRKVYRFVSRLCVGVSLLSFYFLTRDFYSETSSSSSREDVLYSDAVESNLNLLSIKHNDNVQGIKGEIIPAEGKFVKEDKNVDTEDKDDKRLHQDILEPDKGVQEVLAHPDVDIELPPFVEYSPDDGPGEHGRGFDPVLVGAEKEEADRLFALNDFNQYASDRISIHRRLDDTRPDGCKDMVYPSDLPMASVIICFHNEAWSVLLRSVHSIIDRSPPHLLREIILVDDFSSMEHLKRPLEVYMARLGKVKIVRVASRQGLIRARLTGYDVAEGPVLVFLDSHIECFPGWLEPLLARIKTDRRAVPFPFIPVIMRTDLSTKCERALGSVGGFKWDGLTFTWVSIPRRDKESRTADTDPIKSATMPGGLFAIDRSWFTELGTYDPELDFWGGENMELSFKAWMCNGTVEKMPCSQVAHIYRQKNPIKWNSDDAVRRNSMRVAEVWMDEYKEIYYAFSYGKKPFGDVSSRKRLRESLHCHSFRWYIKEVLQVEPPQVLGAGEIRNVDRPVCLDSFGDKKTPGGYSCHGQGFNQRWVLTGDRHLMQGKDRLCYTDKLTFNCKVHLNIWNVNIQAQTIQHAHTGLCLELKIPRNITVGTCNGARNQRWSLPQSVVS